MKAKPSESPISTAQAATNSASAKSGKPHNLEHLHRDRGYRFVTRDPILDEVCRLITQSHRSALWIAIHSGVSATTINNWTSGKTQRPQNLTVDAVLHCLGFKRRIELG